jgi:hypothetical protein
MKPFLYSQDYHYYLFLENITYDFGLKYLNIFKLVGNFNYSKMTHIPAKCIHVLRKLHNEIYCTSSYEGKWLFEYIDLKVLCYSKKQHQSYGGSP